jgi:hypothetical protein
MDLSVMKAFHIAIAKCAENVTPGVTRQHLLKTGLA